MNVTSLAWRERVMTSDSLFSLAINFPPVELRPSRKEESRSIYNIQPFIMILSLHLFYFSLPLFLFYLLFYVLFSFLSFLLCCFIRKIIGIFCFVQFLHSLFFIVIPSSHRSLRIYAKEPGY